MAVKDAGEPDPNLINPLFQSIVLLNTGLCEHVPR